MSLLRALLRASDRRANHYKDSGRRSEQTMKLRAVQLCLKERDVMWIVSPTSERESPAAPKPRCLSERAGACKVWRRARRQWKEIFNISGEEELVTYWPWLETCTMTSHEMDTHYGAFSDREWWLGLHAAECGEPENWKARALNNHNWSKGKLEKRGYSNVYDDWDSSAQLGTYSAGSGRAEKKENDVEQNDERIHGGIGWESVEFRM